ncbi:MAG: metal ABC transporter permease, partial [Gammaproteobacteria bacterium]|nr:metal ABC transporter permease [Gammaproteobacteria bacterium]
MIALTHAPLGIEVVRRGIIFIDLAIAQIAGLGVIVAEIIFDDPSALIVQAIALSLAVIAGVFFHKMETVARDNLEAIIGVSFVLAASTVLLVLAGSTHGGEDLT